MAPRVNGPIEGTSCTVIIPLHHMMSNSLHDPGQTCIWSVFYLVFPESDHPPSILSESAEILKIPPSVPVNLVTPVRRQLVLPDREAPSVPKVTIDKNGNTRLSKNQI